MNDHSPYKKYMVGAKEGAALLGATRQALHFLYKKGRIRGEKVGPRKMLYNTCDILDILETKRLANQRIPTARPRKTPTRIVRYDAHMLEVKKNLKDYFLQHKVTQKILATTLGTSSLNVLLAGRQVVTARQIELLKRIGITYTDEQLEKALLKDFKRKTPEKATDKQTNL